MASFLPWAAPILTLVGWFLVNRQNNTRETRKEARSAADRCKTLAREVAQAGMEFWEGKPGVATWQIKAQLEELEVEIRRFPLNKGQPVLMERYVDLVDAIIGMDFDTPAIKHRAVADPLFAGIAKARHAFIFQIEVQFDMHFR